MLALLQCVRRCYRVLALLSCVGVVIVCWLYYLCPPRCPLAATCTGTGKASHAALWWSLWLLLRLPQARHARRPLVVSMVTCGASRCKERAKHCCPARCHPFASLHTMLPNFGNKLHLIIRHLPARPAASTNIKPQQSPLGLLSLPSGCLLGLPRVQERHGLARGPLAAPSGCC